MTFHWPLVLWLLVLPLGLLAWDLSRRRREAVFSHPKILRAEASATQLSLTSAHLRDGRRPRRWRWRLWLGLALAIVAIARPQWGRSEEQVFEQAREILIAVDLSRSMLAPDVPPSRLDRAKLLITSLLERIEGERVGLLVFAGTAFLQSPLSSDYEILREFLPALGPDYLPQGGTDYDALLRTALEGFGSSSGADRFLIILSDGESQDERWQTRLAELRERKITVIALGIGTADGAMLPDGKGGLVKDERGAVVLSRLQASTLESLARQSNGVYRDASAWVDLAELLERTVEAGRAGEFTEVSRARRVERFQWFLAPALLLFCWSFWREFPVHPRARRLPLQANSVPSPQAAATVAALVILGVLFHVPSSFGRDDPALARPLTETVGRLVKKPQLGASDYAELARSTVTYGERVKGSQQMPEPGAVQDGLAAVDAGEQLDPKAADWGTLREQLEALLRKESPESEDQPEQPPPESGEQNESPDQQKQDQKGAPKETPRNPDDAQAPQEQPQESEEGSGEPGEQQKDASGAERPSAFGDMGAPPEQPPDLSEPPPGETQQVGGQSERKLPAEMDPAMTATLQKLEQLKQFDSPAKLYQLMQGAKNEPTEPGRDW